MNKAAERLKKRIENTEKALDAYYEAEIAIVGGAQSYSVGSRSLTRANLAEIRKNITALENLLANLESQLNGRGRNRMIKGIPIDS